MTQITQNENDAQDTTRRMIRTRKEALLLTMDIAVCAASPFAAIAIRFNGEMPDLHLIPYLMFLPILIAWRIFAAHSFGLYDFKHRLSAVEHVFGGIGAAMLAVGGGYMFLAVAQLYYLPDTYLSRVAAAVDAAMLIAWFGTSRALTLAIALRLGTRVRVLLAGSTSARRNIAAMLREAASPLLNVSEWEADAGLDDETTLQALDARLREGPIDQVVMAGLKMDQASLRDVLALCDRLGVEAYLYPDLDSALLGTTRLVSVGGLPLVSLSTPLTTSPYRVVKRATDLTIAPLALAILAPVLAVLCVLIRMESPGSPLFSQERIGLRGQRFRIVKLRTMRWDDSGRGDREQTAAEDARITRLGGWLRKTRLDEAPQLWNVVRGDMALVGPRPELPYFVDQFSEETPLYQHRALVRPGLTGLAQIHGGYDTDYADKLRYDLIYINSVSFAMDLRIMLATIRIVLTGHGAK
jgi:exopolysaccharide biosynthesis polyprenyl glycosylphosphotransferase